MVTTNSYVCILNYLFNISSIMANEEQQWLNPKYVILQKSDKWLLQTEVNKYIEKWYVIYWQLIIDWLICTQVVIDPLVLERQQLTVREVSDIKKWAISSTVTIPGTVNVSWCECNCWWWD